MAVASKIVLMNAFSPQLQNSKVTLDDQINSSVVRGTPLPAQVCTVSLTEFIFLMDLCCII